MVHLLASKILSIEIILVLLKSSYYQISISYSIIIQDYSQEIKVQNLR